MTRRPKIVSLMTTAKLEGYLTDLKANDCDVSRQKNAGTVRVRDGDSVVLTAIAKGPKQPWIVMFFDSDRIQWTTKGRGDAAIQDV
jgi:hypothetical protein